MHECYMYVRCSGIYIMCTFVIYTCFIISKVDILLQNNDILAEHHNHLDAANDHEILAQDQLGVGAVRDDRFRLGQNFHGLNDNFFTASDDEIFGHSGFSNNGFPNTNFGRKLFKKLPFVVQCT